MKVKEFLSSEDKWTKGAYARAAPAGNWVMPEHKAAVCWCLLGATICCYGDDTPEYLAAIEKLRSMIMLYTNGLQSSVPAFNDSVNFDDIRTVLELADV